MENPGLQGLGQNVHVAILPGTNSGKRKEASQAKGKPRARQAEFPRLGIPSPSSLLGFCPDPTPNHTLRLYNITRLLSWPRHCHLLPLLSRNCCCSVEAVTSSTSHRVEAVTIPGSEPIGPSFAASAYMPWCESNSLCDKPRPILSRRRGLRAGLHGGRFAPLFIKALQRIS
jgi:hypothetical protein